GAASRRFAETAGPRLGQLARKCCATCWLTKLTIVGKSACSRISSDFGCRTMSGPECGIGKGFGKSAGRPAGPATIPKGSLKGAAHEAAPMSQTRSQVNMASASIPKDNVAARIAVVERHVRLENEHDLEGVLGTFGDTARYDDESWGEHYQGRDGVRRFYEQIMKALPD